MTPELRRELLRKIFHFLSLVYLAAFLLLGRGTTLVLLGLWILVEGGLELARLARPGLNEALMRVFGGIHREKESAQVSGVFWTSLGCWLSVLCWGARPEAVTAGLCCLAFGDAAAALVGRRFGRTRLRSGKTLEGTLACFAACLLSCAAAGLRGPALPAAAAVAALVELLPVPVDDNLWLSFLPAGTVFLLLSRGAPGF
ncbi:MAG: hypothetical protein WC969_10165 [Elusimicrobiota bacterium]|jgi:dolichol kinase